jgi:hypothetical protein
MGRPYGVGNYGPGGIGGVEAMVEGADIEVLSTYHGLHCINRRGRKPKGNRTASGYQNKNVKETYISVIHKYVVIWQKTPQLMQRAIL